MISGLQIGQIVHYVLDERDLLSSHKHCVGRHVPAIVTNDWPQLNRDDGYANLRLFGDCGNDGIADGQGATSRTYDENGTPGTWHWPNDVAPRRLPDSDPAMTEVAKHEAEAASPNPEPNPEPEQEKQAPPAVAQNSLAPAAV